MTGEIQTHRQYQPSTDENGGPGSSVYFLEVDGHAFQVPSQAVLDACAQRGARYRVYSLEEADLLLSIEVLDVPR